MTAAETLTEAEKYRAFRNFMFNDLGITKEDIRQWILQAVKQQVTDLANNAFGSFDPKAQAEKLVNDMVRSRSFGLEELRRLVAQEFVRKFDFQFTVKEKPE